MPRSAIVCRMPSILCSKEDSGRGAGHDQPAVPVGTRLRGTQVRSLAQPVDAGQRPVVHEDDVAAQVGEAEWL